jgi:hypothetical protein
MTSSIFDEIIIGSGMAGLYWIYKTKPKNYLVLEKLNRIGGRVYNINWNSNQISLGGGIIKYNNSHTIKLCDELKLEMGDEISNYTMIDWKKSKTDECGEEIFYNINKNLIKYLKKVYFQNEQKIEKNKFTFEEFLNLYIDLELVNFIKFNILYKTYYNADVKSVLWDEMDELLRTTEFKFKFIKNGGYTKLLDELINFVGRENIKLNQNVINIVKKKDIFEIKTSSNEIFRTKKIILATEKNNGIKFLFDNDSLCKKIKSVYSMTSGSNYLRIYSYHPNGHGLNTSYKTSGLVGKVIYINKNILMCTYTEESDALKLNKLLENKTKEEQEEIIYNLFNKCNIPITKPNDIIIKFWNSGVHYNNPGYNKQIKKSLISELNKENIILVGECISDSHGWVNSALESVEQSLNL